MDNILARTAQFQPAARARRFFCFFLKAARLRAVFLRFFTRMAVSYLRRTKSSAGDCRIQSSAVAMTSSESAILFSRIPCTMPTPRPTARARC